MAEKKLIPKSPIRRCQTCDGAGVIGFKKTTVVDGKKIVEIGTKACPARCRKGVIDIRSI